MDKSNIIWIDKSLKYKFSEMKTEGKLLKEERYNLKLFVWTKLICLLEKKDQPN